MGRLKRVGSWEGVCMYACMYVYDAWGDGVCFVLWEDEEVLFKDLQGVR